MHRDELIRENERLGADVDRLQREIDKLRAQIEPVRAAAFVLRLAETGVTEVAGLPVHEGLGRERHQALGRAQRGVLTVALEVLAATPPRRWGRFSCLHRHGLELTVRAEDGDEAAVEVLPSGHAGERNYEVVILPTNDPAGRS